MFIKVSPRWMVKASQVRAIGRDPEDKEGIVQVEYIDGSEVGFMCGTPEERDHILAEIENIYCPKKLDIIQED